MPESIGSQSDAAGGGRGGAGKSQLSLLVKELALGCGFNLVGIGPLEASRYGEEYQQWLAAGKQGEMKYLAQQVEARLDPLSKWPWARSVVVVALAYFQDEPKGGDKQNEAVVGGGRGEMGRIARYAWGRDYHRVMDTKLRQLERAIRQRLAPADFQVRACCDTAPIMEREVAARAGIGWVGKNTLLIHPLKGSWFVLGELITSLELAFDKPMPKHCGTCTRCIEACPTEALTPWHLDARRCLSYLTLEHRGAIGVEFVPAMAEAGFIAGCDICQEVCPFNHDPLSLTELDLRLQPPAPAVNLAEVRSWTELEWDKATRGHAHRRAKFAMWQRNADILTHLKSEESPSE